METEHRLPSDSSLDATWIDSKLNKSAVDVREVAVKGGNFTKVTESLLERGGNRIVARRAVRTRGRQSGQTKSHSGNTGKQRKTETWEYKGSLESSTRCKYDDNLAT